MGKWIRGVIAFLVAGVAWVNIVTILPGNPNYPAAWWKVAVSVIFFVILLSLNEQDPRHDR